MSKAHSTETLCPIWDISMLLSLSLSDRNFLVLTENMQKVNLNVLWTNSLNLKLKEFPQISNK